MTRGPSDLALGAALVDNASRGEVTFVRSGDPTPDRPTIGLARPDPVPPPGTPAARPDAPALRALVPRTPPPVTGAEARWSSALTAALGRRGGRIDWSDLRDLAGPRQELLRGLEDELLRRRLLARTRRDLRVLIIPAGMIAALTLAFMVLAADPIVQGTLLVAGIVAAGPLLVLALLGAPALTLEGVRTHIWLEAFQRTLARTLTSATDLDDALRQSRDMGLAWLDTPDRLLAWAIALGLARQATALLRRTGDADELPPWATALDGMSTLIALGRMSTVIATVDTSSGGGSSLGGFLGGISSGGGGGGGSF